MTPGAQVWESVYRAAREAAPSRNALARRKRRDSLRAEGRCIFCGRLPGDPLREGCRRTQNAQRREHYRETAEGMGRGVRPYRRRKGGAG